MALTRTIGRVMPGALLAAASACAPAISQDYGEPALRVRPFPVLDSALAAHQGAQVSVWAQPDRIDPTKPQPAMVSFRGALAGQHDGWLHLQLAGGDTTRIGLDHVRRVALVRSSAPRNRALGALAGAVGFGLAGWVYTRGNDRGSAGEDFLVVGGAAALGAGLGFLIIPGSRVGAQIYPIVTPRPRVVVP